MATIGFIGLGNMGHGMAINLVKAGHALTVYDLNENAVQALVTAGAKAAASAGEAARDANAVVTMLPAGEHVRAVYTEVGGVIACSAPGTLYLDCSTIDVETARLTSRAAIDAGMLMVDAPVSGGVAAAKAGTLTFMVGGIDDAFAQAETILSDMGQKIVHAGASGAGQAAKICNNMLLAITMIGTSEAFHLADKLGLDRQKLFDISSNASGQNWSMTSYCPVPGPVPTSPANNEYKPGFATAMMLKDLNLAMAAASSADASTPLGSHARDLYTTYNDSGHADKDFSGIFNFIQEKA